MGSSIVLEVNNRNFRGWNKLRSTRSMEQGCGDFSIELVDGGESSAFSEVIAGDRCRLFVQRTEENIAVNQIEILQGFIDTKTRSRTGSATSMSVTGRDITQDLVDCSAIYGTSNSWVNATLVKIVEDICKPFNIWVDDRTNPGPKFKNFTLQNGESAFSAIERACRQQGVLPLTDRFGNLVLTYSVEAGSPRIADLIEGVNILEIEETYTTQARFSQYIFKGQNSGNGARWDSKITRLKAEATDSGVKRYRPLVVLSEGKTGQTKLQKRANWEAQVRAGRALTHTVKVQDWFISTADRSSETQPWQPNQLVNLISKPLGINEKRVITSVTYELDPAAGRTALLVLKHPSTYAADPDGKVTL